MSPNAVFCISVVKRNNNCLPLNQSKYVYGFMADWLMSVDIRLPIHVNYTILAHFCKGRLSLVAIEWPRGVNKEAIVLFDSTILILNHAIIITNDGSKINKFGVTIRTVFNSFFEKVYGN